VAKHHPGNDLSKIQVQQAGSISSCQAWPRIIADGPDGSTGIVGGLLIDRMLFQDLTDHRLLKGR
jgi:hypothetical protein